MAVARRIPMHSCQSRFRCYSRHTRDRKTVDAPLLVMFTFVGTLKSSQNQQMYRVFMVNDGTVLLRGISTVAVKRFRYAEV